jgi:hypothetical protein
MIKTFTSNHISNFSTSISADKVVDEDQENELFYQSVKAGLDKLKKEPSGETIDKILSYSKNFKGDI